MSKPGKPKEPADVKRGRVQRESKLAKTRVDSDLMQRLRDGLTKLEKEPDEK